MTLYNSISMGSNCAAYLDVCRHKHTRQKKRTSCFLRLISYKLVTLQYKYLNYLFTSFLFIYKQQSIGSTNKKEWRKCDVYQLIDLYTLFPIIMYVILISDAFHSKKEIFRADKCLFDEISPIWKVGGEI